MDGILPNGEYTDIPEEWFPLIDFFIPGIKPWYEVSNYGKIYNKYTDNELHKICKYFEDNGTNITVKEVLNHIEFDYSEKSDKQIQALNSCISNLRNKKNHSKIYAINTIIKV